MLEEGFLGPLGLTKHRAAEGIGVPAQRVGDIVGGSTASILVREGCPWLLRGGAPKVKLRP